MTDVICKQCGGRADKRSKTGLCRNCWQLPVDRLHLKPEEAAYIAGLVDGEAHLAIARELPTAGNRRRTPIYRLRLEIAMTDRGPVEYIASLMPYAKTVRQNAKRRRLPYYKLRFKNGEVRAILPQILPYLHAKQEQAKLCLELEALRQQYLIGWNLYEKGQIGRSCMPESFIHQAEDLYWKLRSLHLNKKPRYPKKAIERFI
jgi:hypothetical protein